MDVDRWVFVEVGNSAIFSSDCFYFFFQGNRKQSLSAESESRA